MSTSSQPPSEPFEATEPSDFLILLLYAKGRSGKFGEPVEGVTRLQKLMFLLQQGQGLGDLVAEAKAYGYDPYKMGPYSAELRDAVDELQSADIIRTERLVYLLNDDSDGSGHPDPDFDSPRGGSREVESMRFRLAPFGMQIGKDLWSGLSEERRGALVEFKGFFNSLSLRQLLIFTYERHPAFTTASEIKGQLGLS